MNKFIIIITLSLLFKNLSAQRNLIILDTVNNRPIKDVYLIDEYKEKYNILDYSDAKGYINIPFETDTLKLSLSHISYNKKFLPSILQTGSLSDTIYLVPKSTLLSDIVVENFKTNKLSIIGFYKKGRKQNLVDPSNRTISGTVIPIDSTIKKFKIETLYCNFEKLNLVEKKKTKCKAGFIFHFLKISAGTPTNEDVLDPIIVDYNNLKENFSLTIPNSLIIDNDEGGIFVGIELQDIDCIGQSVTHKNYDLINLRSDVNLNWIYHSWRKQWEQYDNSLFAGKLSISLKIRDYN